MNNKPNQLPYVAALALFLAGIGVWLWVGLARPKIEPETKCYAIRFVGERSGVTVKRIRITCDDWAP